MDIKQLIALIAIGLPEFTLNKIKIDKTKLEENTDIFNELRQLESLVNKKHLKKTFYRFKTKKKKKK